MSNARKIENIDTNDMNFKRLETTKDIVLSPKNEYGDPQRPDATHKWTAKVSDGQHYVGDFQVKVNATSLVVDSEDFTKLPAGKYELELWEQWTDEDGTDQLSIYPSPSQTIPFQIFANIPDQEAEEIKQIGIQDVINKAVINAGLNLVVDVSLVDHDQPASVMQKNEDGKDHVTFSLPKAADGKTPVKGVDYWTDADQQAIQDDVTKIVGDAYTKAKSDVEDEIENGKW